MAIYYSIFFLDFIYFFQKLKKYFIAMSVDTGEQPPRTKAFGQKSFKNTLKKKINSSNTGQKFQAHPKIR